MELQYKETVLGGNLMH